MSGGPGAGFGLKMLAQARIELQGLV